MFLVLVLFNDILNDLLSSAAFNCLTLREIENELSKVTAASWFSLGVQLGVGLEKLREIEKDHRQDAQRCKTEVLDWWLQNAPEISWNKLAQALEAMGGHATLVQNLKTKVLSLSEG